MACVCEPPVAVLDEPTTGLDVLTQDRILFELDRLRHEQGMAMVYVSHDLAVVARMADRIVVMYAGRVVEDAPRPSVIERPRHPYTRALVAAIPDFRRPALAAGHPGRLGRRGRVARRLRLRAALRARRRAALRGACPCSPTLRPGTRCAAAAAHELAAAPRVRRARCAARAERRPRPLPLLEVSGARGALPQRPRGPARRRATCRSRSSRAAASRSWASRAAARRRSAAASRGCTGRPAAASCSTASRSPQTRRSRPLDVRRRIQIVFQNPFESLNPRHQVRRSIARPLRVLQAPVAPRRRRSEVGELLERVRLPKRLGDRFPVELSGGERQRVAIARALAAEPDLLICDEVTSALDVSVQAAVLELLQELQRELGLSMLFITHNLGVVACVADSVLVMDQGSLVRVRPRGAGARAPGATSTRSGCSARRRRWRTSPRHS